MAQQNSFDIVSNVDRAEVTNAIQQTIKEVRQRFDFKGSTATVELEKDELVLSAEDETKLRNMNDIFQQKLVRRSVPLKALSYGTVDPAAGGTMPMTHFIRVLLPLPLVPSRTTVSACDTPSEMSSSTRTAP